MKYDSRVAVLFIPEDFMALENGENSLDPENLPQQVREILRSLSKQDKVLIACSSELYGGRWGLLRKDLADRLEGRPYVLKLGDRIKEDIERSHELEKIENDYQIKLADYITL